MSKLLKKLKKHRIFRSLRLRSSNPNVQKIVQSRLMDLAYYNLQLDKDLPNVFAAAQHYLDRGASQKLNPNCAFDTDWYIGTYLRNSPNSNPLLDFIENGERLNRDPSAIFSCSFYLSMHQDVAKAGVPPLLHFITSGRVENRVTTPFKDIDHLPIRFRNLSSEVLPQDGEVHFHGSFSVEPVAAFAEKIIQSSYKQAFEDHEIPEMNTGLVAQSYPASPYIAAFENKTIVGGSRLILKDTETVLSDEIHAFLPITGASVRPSTFVVQENGKLRVPLVRQYPSQIKSGIHAMHEYAENYFHFLAEVLPRIYLADEIGLDPSLPLLIQKKLSPNLRELLDVMNVNKRKLIELNDRQIYNVGSLYFASDVSSIQDVYDRSRLPEETVLHLTLLRRVVERIVAHYPSPTSGDSQPKRKIYARRGQRYRGLRNESEVEDYLVEKGFQVVSTEHLSVRSQINVFRDAEVVICPTGAAVTNILWCRPGTPVNIFMSDHFASPEELWTQLGQVSGCHVTITNCERGFSVDGKYSMHDDYHVDLSALAGYLDSISKPQQRS